MKDAAKSAIKKILGRPAKSALKALGYEVVTTSKLQTLKKAATAAPKPKPARIDPNLLFVPRETNLSFQDLVAFLESHDLTGFTETDSTGKTYLHLPLSLKAEALAAIARFCAVEGARIYQNCTGIMKVTTDLISLSAAFEEAVLADMRLASRRSTHAIEFQIEFWEEDEQYIQGPRGNLYSRRVWRTTLAERGALVPGKFRDIAELFDFPHAAMVDFPIDLVFTWVNADDPDWQELYKAHVPAEKWDGNSRSRFHSRDELLFALRSWAKFAPLRLYRILCLTRFVRSLGCDLQT